MLLGQIKARKDALNLSEKAYKVAQGVDSVESLQDFYAETFAKDDHHHALPLTEVTHNLGELIEQCYTEEGARWRLNCLNKSLGSLRKGDFGFIFARPETGKTTFLASEVTAFLNDSNSRVVWLNNEEQGSKVMLRIYQAFFGATTEQLFSNWKRYEHEFLSRTGNRFRLFDSATIGRKEVEQVVAQISPSVVIYDQIDKIKGFNNDREDLRLGSIYQWARELAKGNHAAIGVCQASGTAEGVRYLTMDHVANALTAKQAEADWILGIGCSHDPTEANIRFLNISKNKLLGDSDSIPNLRHGRFEVLFEPSIARYTDIVTYT
jgi:replicative DNA helicase